MLVVGGHQFGSPAPAGDELYDPVAHAWAAAPPPPQPVAGQAAVRLDDGRVLVAGGVLLPGGHENLRAAELYNPTAQSWTAAAPMAVARYHASLTLLPDGRALVAGGQDTDQTATATAEVYDPAANRWTPAPPMATPRMEASAILLRTGDVLVAGGQATPTAAASLSSAELYDYRKNAWAPAGDMTSVHAVAVSALLPDGTALVAGGFDYAGGFSVATAATDYYNPERNRWDAGPAMQLARGGPGYATLPDGNVIAVGGQSRQANVRTEATGELLDWHSRLWSLLPPTGVVRPGPTVTVLRAGSALIAGGSREQTTQLFLASAVTAAAAAPVTLAGALAQNLPLAAVTAGLLAAVLAQLAWRRRQAAGGR